jgi:hypothetical protein
MISLQQLRPFAEPPAFLHCFGGKDSVVAQIFVGLTAALSAIATSLGPSKKANKHAELSRGFTDLAAEIVKREPTSSNLKLVKAQRLKIEKDEPPVKRLVDLQAQNEEARSRGVPESKMVPLKAWQRCFGYVITIGMPRLERWMKEHYEAEAKAENVASEPAHDLKASEPRLENREGEEKQ